ncbi:hypothetical protein G3N55_09695 [Dissulfurirhabdus thermomarina]|uniref:Uncharacterized protein n=1 Tax=Dissulfurirhabdus thermomarina TaxID=1765737 RepID=A0A6N9TPB3_DISTH|nr:hypothetical protein [Dissulfurirhabdus thermomarina]NDY43112.1 hypothetical protein [Dissulfurirhabdus thermomarina]NMX24446.1 hypothetical protein [Dissulfurirhabdus thermomarina]
MRCTKCGTISFDHLEFCGQCNHDLRELHARLGAPPPPNPELTWFADLGDVQGMEAPPLTQVPEEEPSGEIPLNLGEIDISDLTPEAAAPGPSTEPSPEASAASPSKAEGGGLGSFADDEDFQKALEEALSLPDEDAS